MLRLEALGALAQGVWGFAGAALLLGGGAQHLDSVACALGQGRGARVSGRDLRAALVDGVRLGVEGGAGGLGCLDLLVQLPDLLFEGATLLGGVVVRGRRGDARL